MGVEYSGKAENSLNSVVMSVIPNVTQHDGKMIDYNSDVSIWMKATQKGFKPKKKKAFRMCRCKFSSILHTSVLPPTFIPRLVCYCCYCYEGQRFVFYCSQAITFSFFTNTLNPFRSEEEMTLNRIFSE